MKAELEAKERKHLNKRPRDDAAAIEDDTGNLILNIVIYNLYYCILLSRSLPKYLDSF